MIYSGKSRSRCARLLRRAAIAWAYIMVALLVGPAWARAQTSPDDPFAERPGLLPAAVSASELGTDLVGFLAPCPFDVSVRTGPAIVKHNGELERVLDPGYTVDLGARTYCHSSPAWLWPSAEAAWTLSGGLRYTFHDADNDTQALSRSHQTTVTRGLFTPSTVNLPTDSTFAVSEFHHVAVYGGAGRCWTWPVSFPRGAHFWLQADGGGRLGHVHASLRLLTTNIRGLQPGDQVVGGPPRKITDITWGLYTGVDMGFVVPCRRAELLLGARGELQHDWMEITDHDDQLTEIQVLLVAGVRF
ncbi:MAG: hypothetical protein C4297_08970 [Gemmataceae bacterium]